MERNAEMLLLIAAVCIFTEMHIGISASRLPMQGEEKRRSLLANGLGLTPLMRWNSWNHFPCEVTEKIIREMADALVRSGLTKLGYTYVNIDDCWAELARETRDES